MLSGRFSERVPLIAVGWSVGWLVIGYLIGGWLVVWVVGCWLFDWWLVGRSVRWSVCLFVSWLFAYLLD